MIKLFTLLSHTCMALFCFTSVLLPKTVSAQISMGRDSTSYSQNFDALPDSGTAVWESGTSYIEGWTVQRTKNTNTIVANHGNNIGGNLYSYGSIGSKERALGSMSSLLAGEYAWGVLLQNNTGDTIDHIDISYVGEQWRITNKTAPEHRILFFYAVSSDPSTFKLSPKSDEGWVPYPELNFYGPHFKVQGRALDGNAPANKRSLAATIPVNIPNGHYIMLRWKDEDEYEADHGLAIDDFSMSWSVRPEQPITILPVELLHFIARSYDAAVELQWQTASEDQNDYFVVERSSDGGTFESLGKVDGAGTTALGASYEFVDEQPLPALAYYRLKQVDEDGSFTFSSIVAVTRAVAGRQVAQVFPTITTDYLQVNLGQERKARTAFVTDMVGKQLLHQTIEKDTLQHTFNVNGLRSGTYILVLQDEQGQRQVTRFIKR
jgi:hypothetical protein